jgi:putative serine protease PepD
MMTLMTRTRTVPLLLAGVALAGGVTGAVAVRAIDDDTPAAATSTLDDAVSTSPVAKADSDEPLAQAAAKILQSVVSITATGDQGTAEGSGVVISEDGLVLTNNHVVASEGDGAELEVTLPDGSTKEATVKGTDPASDLAVIQLKDAGDLTPATLGSSSDLAVGETVLAVGSPLGLDGSVSAGIVSALGRAITLGSPEQQSPFGNQQSTGPTAVIDAIQTDAAINPGNSGGPLVNSDGDVVGINTAIASLAQGMDGTGGNIGVGFAIPIDEAKAIAQELADTGEATHAYLGVSLEESQDGVGVAEVVEGGPAADAGLKAGDVVTKIDGDAVGDVASLTAAIRAHDPGDKVKLTVVRDGKESTVEVELGTYPKTQS